MRAHTGTVQGRVMKTRAFMEQHAQLSATCTRSGYNPLLEDFANTSFYLGHTGQCVIITYIKSSLHETGFVVFQVTAQPYCAHGCCVLCRAEIGVDGPTHTPYPFFVLKRHVDIDKPGLA